MGNLQWRNEAMQAASEETLADEQEGEKAICVGGMVLENNLRVTVQSIYLALAKAARI